MERKVDLFLDSGAFSAWTQGTSINIDEYIKFIKENIDYIEVYANLDVIGLGGKQPNRLTAEATLANQRYMEAQGLKPMPCFHFGEPYEFLDFYVQNYDYIALGVAGNSGPKLTPWLNECFGKHICDKNGMPKVKVHGFAVTSLATMLDYPWYSVDSTSWVITGRMGSIYIPPFKGGKYHYDQQPWKIPVSNQSPRMSDANQHISTYPPDVQKVFLEYITMKGYTLGKSEFKRESQKHELANNEKWAEKKPKSIKEDRLLEIIVEPGLSNTYQLRDEMNIIYFLDLEKNYKPWPWAFKTNDLQPKLKKDET